MGMKSPPALPPIPWKRIGFILVAAALVFWGIGFVIGLVVRLALGA